MSEKVEGGGKQEERIVDRKVEWGKRKKWRGGTEHAYKMERGDRALRLNEEGVRGTRTKWRGATGHSY